MLVPSDISIVVPVGQSAPHWERCARSLKRLQPAPGEIVVVLDGHGPTSETHLCSARDLQAEVVVLASREGPAVARNRGADTATGEVLFFLDSDIEAPADLVAQLVHHFESLRGNAVDRRGVADAPSGGDLGSQNGPVAGIIGSYDAAPADSGWVSQYRNLLHHHVHQTSHEVASTFWSGCGAVLRQSFLDVGGFDEGYADPSIEDIEFGARLLRSGQGIRLVKSLQVKHLKCWTFTNMVATDLFRRAIPWTEQMLASGGLVNDLNLKTRDRVSVGLAFLAPLLALSLLLPVPSGWRLGVASASLASLVLLLVLNWGFFRRLGGLRSPAFALAAIPLYWVYLVICGLGFGIGTLRHLRGRGRRRKRGVHDVVETDSQVGSPPAGKTGSPRGEGQK